MGVRLATVAGVQHGGQRNTPHHTQTCRGANPGWQVHQATAEAASFRLWWVRVARWKGGFWVKPG